MIKCYELDNSFFMYVFTVMTPTPMGILGNGGGGGGAHFESLTFVSMIFFWMALLLFNGLFPFHESWPFTLGDAPCKAITSFSEFSLLWGLGFELSPNAYNETGSHS